MKIVYIVVYIISNISQTLFQDPPEAARRLRAGDGVGGPARPPAPPQPGQPGALRQLQVAWPQHTRQLQVAWLQHTRAVSELGQVTLLVKRLENIRRTK